MDLHKASVNLTSSALYCGAMCIDLPSPYPLMVYVLSVIVPLVVPFAKTWEEVAPETVIHWILTLS